MMRSRSSVALPISLVLGVLACGGSADVPSMPDTVADPSTALIFDPAGDTFGLPGLTQWDVTGLSITRETDGITVRVDFANNVELPTPGDPNALVGLVELDLDQNVVTGKLGILDQLRKDGGATGMGVDAALNLSNIAADSTLIVYDMGGNPTGRAKVAIGGHRLTIHVPSALIGNDDGYLDAAVIVANSRSITDLAPQSGHLSLSPPTPR
ncbi:MAG TPA: hypothetical protein VF461_07305 [Gemmatimonadaceae bacterium]